MDAHSPDYLGAYVNLPKLMQYRGGFTLAREPLRPSHVSDSDLEDGLTPRDTMSDLTMKFGRWELIATRPNRGERAEGVTTEVMVVFIILENSKAASSSSEFRNLFGLAEKYAQDLGRDTHALAEVLVLASEAVTKKTNLKQQMVHLAKASAQKTPRLWVHLYPFHIFSVVVPEHPCVPKHERLPAEDVVKYAPMIQFSGTDAASRAKAAAAMLPLIHSAEDAAAIWLGIRPGDFVLVHRPSATAGEFTFAVRFAV